MLDEIEFGFELDRLRLDGFRAQCPGAPSAMLVEDDFDSILDSGSLALALKFGKIGRLCDRV